MEQLEMLPLEVRVPVTAVPRYTRKGYSVLREETGVFNEKWVVMTKENNDADNSLR